MNLPTKDEIEQMELPEVNKLIKQLVKEYHFDKPLTEYMTPELWDKLDDIVNTYLYLDDRRHWLEHYAHLRGDEKV